MIINKVFKILITWSYRLIFIFFIFFFVISAIYYSLTIKLVDSAVVVGSLLEFSILLIFLLTIFYLALLVFMLLMVYSTFFAYRILYLKGILVILEKVIFKSKPNLFHLNIIKKIKPSDNSQIELILSFLIILYFFLNIVHFAGSLNSLSIIFYFILILYVGYLSQIRFGIIINNENIFGKAFVGKYLVFRINQIFFAFCFITLTIKILLPEFLFVLNKLTILYYDKLFALVNDKFTSLYNINNNIENTTFVYNNIVSNYLSPIQNIFNPNNYQISLSYYNNFLLHIIFIVSFFFLILPYIKYKWGYVKSIVIIVLLIINYFFSEIILSILNTSQSNSTVEVVLLYVVLLINGKIIFDQYEEDFINSLKKSKLFSSLIIFIERTYKNTFLNDFFKMYKTRDRLDNKLGTCSRHKKHYIGKCYFCNTEVCPDCCETSAEGLIICNNCYNEKLVSNMKNLNN